MYLDFLNHIALANDVLALHVRTVIARFLNKEIRESLHS